MALYFQLFWMPTLASAVLLAMLWTQGELSGSVTWLLAWFLLALAAQYFGTAVGVWIGGLVLQTSLAVFMLLKLRLSRI